jgi:hypothetical protein
MEQIRKNCSKAGTNGTKRVFKLGKLNTANINQKKSSKKEKEAISGNFAKAGLLQPTPRSHIFYPYVWEYIGLEVDLQCRLENYYVFSLFIFCNIQAF